MIRPGIGSCIRSTLARPTKSAGLLWTYSVSTPGPDAGKVTFAASATYVVNVGGLSLWAKIPLASVRIFCELYNSGNDRTSIYYNSNTLFIAENRGGASLINNSAGFVNDARWHHYAITWDGSGYAVYVDSVQKINFPGNYVLSLTNPQISLGSALSTVAFPTAGNFRGLSLYNAKLTDIEIRDLYAANVVPASCVARWEFTQGSGSIVPTFGSVTSGALGTNAAWTAVVPSNPKLPTNGNIAIL